MLYIVYIACDDYITCIISYTVYILYSFYLSIYLSIYQSIYLSIYLTIFLIDINSSFILFNYTLLSTQFYPSKFQWLAAFHPTLLSHWLAHHSLSGMDFPSRYERDLNRPNFGHLGCRKGLCLSTVLNQLYFQFARVVYRSIVGGVDRTGMLL